MAAGVVTALEVQKRNKQRVNVFIDGEFAFALGALEAARLRKGQPLTEAEIALLKGDDAIGKAVDSAARFLGFRPRSVQEVRRNLTEKEHPPEVIDAAIERLKVMGYLDDEAFARYWAQNRETFKPLSQRALRQELKQKGVAESVIGEALDALDENELAYRAATGNVRRLRGRTKREFRTKMSAFLQRRGFSYSTTHDAVMRLEEELGAQDSNYFNLNEQSEEE